jgi:hypothetical protein
VWLGSDANFIADSFSLRPDAVHHRVVRRRTMGLHRSG